MVGDDTICLDISMPHKCLPLTDDQKLSAIAAVISVGWTLDVVSAPVRVLARTLSVSSECGETILNYLRTERLIVLIRQHPANNMAETGRVRQGVMGRWVESPASDELNVGILDR